MFVFKCFSHERYDAIRSLNSVQTNWSPIRRTIPARCQTICPDPDKIDPTSPQLHSPCTLCDLRSSELHVSPLNFPCPALIICVT